MSIRVLISVLNWNNAARTRACLDSLGESGCLQRADVRVVVTDNGSNPDDAAQLLQMASEYGVAVRCNRQNLGFTGGHNPVLQQAVDEGIPFVWLVNNDCLVTLGTLDALLAAAEADPRSGALSPCLAYEDTREVYFAGAIQNWQALNSVWCALPWDEDFHRRHRDAVWALGTALLLRTEALAEVGLLQEKLFAYFEDDELGQRLQRHGWRTVMLRDALVLHNRKTESSVRRAPYFYYLTARNWYWFYRHHAPASARRRLSLRLVAGAVDRAAILRRTGDPERAEAALLGLCDGHRHHLGAPVLGRPLPWRWRAIDWLMRIVNSLHGLLQRARAGQKRQPEAA